MDSTASQKRGKHVGFAAIWKAMEGGDVWVPAKRHFAWQARYKRHPHQTCQEIGALIRWEGLRFGASDLQVASKWFCAAGAAPVNFSPPAQYFRQMGWKIARHWHEAVSSALNFSFLKEARRLVSFLMLSRARIETSRKISLFWSVTGLFWRTSRGIASFWNWQLSLVVEDSHTCFLSDR